MNHRLSFFSVGCLISRMTRRLGCGWLEATLPPYLSQAYTQTAGDVGRSRRSLFVLVLSQGHQKRENKFSHDQIVENVPMMMMIMVMMMIHEEKNNQSFLRKFVKFWEEKLEFRKLRHKFFRFWYYKKNRKMTVGKNSKNLHFKKNLSKIYLISFLHQKPKVSKKKTLTPNLSTNPQAKPGLFFLLLFQSWFLSFFFVCWLAYNFEGTAADGKRAILKPNKKKPTKKPTPREICLMDLSWERNRVWI